MSLDSRYIAGFFDGEGSVCLEHTSNGMHNGKRIYRLRVTLSQKDPSVLYEIKKTFGGYIAVNNSKCSQLNLTGPMAETFLREIEPHLLLKRSVVEIALAYRSLVNCRLTYGGRGGPMPTHIAQLISKMRQDITNINRWS